MMTALATIFALALRASGIGGGGSALISTSPAMPVIGGLEKGRVRGVIPEMLDNR